MFFFFFFFFFFQTKKKKSELKKKKKKQLQNPGRNEMPHISHFNHEPIYNNNNNNNNNNGYHAVPPPELNPHEDTEKDLGLNSMGQAPPPIADFPAEGLNDMVYMSGSFTTQGPPHPSTVSYEKFVGMNGKIGES